MADRIKIVLAAGLLVLGLVGFYYFSTQPLVARVGMVLAGIAAGVAVGWGSKHGQQLREFTKQATEETRKVVWPSRKESIQTTAIVFGFVVVMAVFLWFTDKLLEWSMYDLILGWKR
jgi:preprotein translocase subunit SecE